MFIYRLIKLKPTLPTTFKNFSALTITDEFYEIPPEPITLSPPICPICNKFLDDKNKNCKFLNIPNTCPLEFYHKNNKIIDILKKKLIK